MEKEVQATFGGIEHHGNLHRGNTHCHLLTDRERENRPERGSKEKEVCKQPPKLKLLENEMNVEIQRVRGDQVHVASQRGQHAKRQIRPRDHGNVKIHPRYVHHDEPIDTKLSSGLIVDSGGMGGSGV